MYLRRYDLICTYLHWDVLKYLGQSVEDLCMRHKSHELTSCGNVTVIYDRSIITKQCVLHNKPDQIIWNKDGRTGLIVDVAVPMDGNCVKKYVGKLTMYQDLELEIQISWNIQQIKTIAITVVSLWKICECLQEI